MYDRWYVLATFVSGYVALAALRHAGAAPPVLLVLAGNPLLLAWVWRNTRPGMGLTKGVVHATALSAARVCAAGTALWVAARVIPVARPTFDFAANVGLAGAVVAAQVALARIVHREGLIKPPRSARSLVPAVFCAVLWALGAALPAVRALWPEHELVSELASHYVTRGASMVTWAALLGATLRCWLTQRLSMGVAERAAGALALALTALATAALGAIGGFVHPDYALSLGVLGAALACVWAATTEDPAEVSSAWRVAVTLTLLGVPVALVAGLLANDMPRHAGVITIGACVVAVGLGSVARGVARSLSPEPSRWLAALNAACRAALVPEPNAAIVATLESLQGLERRVRTRPELWRADPPEVLSVDVAGYLHTARGEPPSSVYELMRCEPEHMLRRDVLAQLEVRRPEVRPVLAWMDSREAFAVTLVCGDDQTSLGFVLFPRGRRTATATLVEAAAARQLAERLSAILSLSSSMARAREREQNALGRAEALSREVTRLEAIITEHRRPRDLLIDALAASVRVATYSARARLVLEQVQRLGAGNVDATLEVPVGVDPLGWACVLHLASSRRAGPLVVADGTASAAHAPEHWTERLASPGARAGGGTLLLLNAAAMPHAAQDALAIALSGRATADSAETYALIATLAGSPRELLEARHLSRALAHFLLANVVRLPTLLERAEDLRGLVLDRLCRSGVRYAGEPLGIEPQAMSLLVDHTWPGNDAELQSVVERAARVASGERVSLADLAAVGFVGTPLEEEPVVALPRRRSERPASVPVLDEAAEERPLVRRRRRR